METNLLERPVTGSTVLSLLPAAPQPRESWGWRFAVSDTTPFWARFNTKWFLESCQGISGDLIETAVLVVSELVTNAYAAALGLCEETLIDLSLRLFGDHLLIEVIDSSPEVPVRNPPGDAGAESGRGLALVEALSREWGYFRYRDKKVVYCVLPLQARADGG
jgi:anti-sigma regulatory factor (Ser/Thr protein kinase)